VATSGSARSRPLNAAVENRVASDVLQVVTSTAPRGAEHFALALEPEFIERGLSVRTVALTRGDPDVLDVATLGSTRRGIDTIRALRERAKRAKVVVAHGSTTLPVTAIATFGTGVPFIYRNIGDPHYWSTSVRRRAQSRLLLGRASRVVALTNQTAARIEDRYRVASSKISVIPRGVSAADFPLRIEADKRRARATFGIADDASVAICVGALSSEKNVGNAVRAVSMLPPRWQLIIAGDGPDRSVVEREVAGLPAGRVRMLGSIDNVAELMAAADLLVLPSRTEGLPGVVIEAGMVGIPSVATRVGFVTEIIDDGVSGHLVPSNDAAAMAEAIEKAEPNLSQFGQEAHRRAVEGFSLTATADKWHRLLDEVMTS